MTELVERDLMTASDPPTEAPHRRSRWAWWVGLAVIVVAAVAVGLSLGGAESTTESEAPTSVNSAEAVRTDLVDETTYDGTLGTTEDDALVAPVSGVVSSAPEPGATIAHGEAAFAIDGEPVVVLPGDTPAYRDFQLSADTRPVAARATGTVTEIVEVGTILEQGDVFARIDGEPVVVLYGEIPMYRNLEDLSDNMTGVDVQQLEEALADLGYNEDESVSVDDEFTQATEDMVEDWQSDLGIEDDDGVVTPADVIFVPGPAQVIGAFAGVGDRVTDGAQLLELTDGEAMAGPDLGQLEQALADLGFDADGQLVLDETYDMATAHAIRQLQTSIGATDDGILRAGEVRFSTTAVRVTDVDAEVGTTVSAGTPILTLSSPDKIVTFDLPAADQDLVVVGDVVSIELPDGEEVPGTVSFVAETATTSADQQSAVFEVEVTLDDPTVATDLEQAPVDVSVVSDSVSDVVAVPVSALVALAEGGYAVEILDGAGDRRLVRVEPGFYAGGFVEITSDEVEPGTSVVVP